MSKQEKAARLTATILANLEKPRPVRTEAEVFAGLSDDEAAFACEHCGGFESHLTTCSVYGFPPEACCECHLSKSEFREGPVLRCLRCQKALCFLCTGAHLDCRNRCEEAK